MQRPGFLERKQRTKIDWESVLPIAIFICMILAIGGVLIYAEMQQREQEASVVRYTTTAYTKENILPEGFIIRCIAGVEYYASGRDFHSISPRFLPGKNIPESCKGEIGK